MKEIYELKKEVDGLKLKIKDWDNDMTDKAKLSLLEHEDWFLKEELKQLIVEKLLDLKSNKTNVHKPREQSTIRKGNMTHSTNEINDTYLILIIKRHQKHRLEKTQIDTTMSIGKVLSLVTFKVVKCYLCKVFSMVTLYGNIF